MRIALILATLYVTLLAGCDSGKQAPPPKLFAAWTEPTPIAPTTRYSPPGRF